MTYQTIEDLEKPTTHSLKNIDYLGITRDEILTGAVKARQNIMKEEAKTKEDKI